MEAAIREDLLQHKDIFYRAWSGISFNPEKRGASALKEYSEQLNSDLNELGANSGNYREKFIDKLLNCLRSESACMSCMITGPANYPVRSQNKKHDASRNNWEKFYNWRKKYFKAVNRVSTPSPELDLDNALSLLDKEIVLQLLMKATNKIIKKKNITKENKIKQLVKELGYKEELAGNLFSRGWWGDGFAPFELTGINNKIKRLKEKLLTMKSRIETKSTFEAIEFEGGSIDIEADRVVVYHDEKPEQEVINNLKSHGFKWSRKFTCWCRKHTARALLDAKQICGITR